MSLLEFDAQHTLVQRTYKQVVEKLASETLFTQHDYNQRGGDQRITDEFLKPLETYETPQAQALLRLTNHYLSKAAFDKIVPDHRYASNDNQVNADLALLAEFAFDIKLRIHSLTPEVASSDRIVMGSTPDADIHFTPDLAGEIRSTVRSVASNQINPSRINR